MSDMVRVWCAGCGNYLWATRAGETKCPCGVTHTVVLSNG